jgi:hypothetical protein
MSLKQTINNIFSFHLESGQHKMNMGKVLLTRHYPARVQRQ